MSALTIQRDDFSDDAITITDHEQIAAKLNAIGVQFEAWEAGQALSAQADQQEVMEAYAKSIAQLSKQYDFSSVDVVSLHADHPDKATLRQKFLSEHTHDDFEIRFFVDGSGLFYLHVDGKVYLVLCERGDLISVPANTTHWFDMGENPNFKCIRFFTTPNGWEGKFTGSDIATHFPDFDEFKAALA